MKVEAISKAQITRDLRALGIGAGDTVLIRANLGAIGPMEGWAAGFVEALLEVVGGEGTIVSLAFTPASFLRPAKVENAFHDGKPSYAGALPNTMLRHPQRQRSRHPMCSYVAIGKHAALVTDGHDHRSGAYDPVEKIIALGGKCLLVGCVQSSPGFTTAHLAEAKLGLYRRVIFPRLRSVYFKNEEGGYELFRRRDPGLCSQSYEKFYAHYDAGGFLHTGTVGEAYSIWVPAREAFALEYKLLRADPQFSVCGRADCSTCNAMRWDRLHRFPQFVLARLLRRRQEVARG